MTENAAPNPIAVNLFSEISTADQLLRGRLSEVLPKGMEISHLQLLVYLDGQAIERSPAQMAQAFHLTKGAMTNTLGKLELAGYVHIRPDWADARRKLVTISPSGRMAKENALRAVAPVFDRIMSQIDEDRVRAALPLLRELRRVLE